MIQKLNLSPLKIAGLLIALIGAGVAQAAQRRETEEFVEKALAERFDQPTSTEQ